MGVSGGRGYNVRPTDTPNNRWGAAFFGRGSFLTAALAFIFIAFIISASYHIDE
jgi:hypothetical protein